MPRNSEPASAPAVYECVEPFSPAVGANGVPDVYGYGQQVLEGHPVLKRYGAHFELVTDRVLRRERESLPAGVPGEPARSFVPDQTPSTTPEQEQETING